MIKDLKYWTERASQIQWRIDEKMREITTMQKDMRECDTEINKLRAEQKGGK